MLKLKLQYFAHLMWRADSLEKTLMLGKIEGKRKRGRQRMRWLDGINDQWRWVWMNSGSWRWTGRPGMLWSVGHEKSDMTEWLNWTELKEYIFKSQFIDKVQTGVCKFLDILSYYKVIAIKTCVIDMAKHGTVENGQKMIHLFKKIWLWCFKSV